MNRAEYTLAMRRESPELERTLVDQRVDEAYEQVYEYLEPAATHLRSVLNSIDRRALDELERAYQKAIEHAARSGIGCRARRKTILPQRSPSLIPAVCDPAAAPDAAVLADPDRLLSVRPCS